MSEWPLSRSVSDIRPLNAFRLNIFRLKFGCTVRPRPARPTFIGKETRSRFLFFHLQSSLFKPVRIDMLRIMIRFTKLKYQMNAPERKLFGQWHLGACLTQEPNHAISSPCCREISVFSFPFSSIHFQRRTHGAGLPAGFCSRRTGDHYRDQLLALGR